MLPALICGLFLLPAPLLGADEPLPTVADKTKDFTALEGLLDLLVDEVRGRIYVRVPQGHGPRGECGRYLHVAGLVQGMGSNPVGLDRGKLGKERVVVFRRVGGRLLIEELNLAFRARSESAAERRAVAESFATSVIWGAEIIARDPNGAALVDFTSFVVRDVFGVASALSSAGQGSYSLDADRSGPELGACLGFPDNSELEATLTFGGSTPGRDARETVPTAESLTVTQHQSFLRLPDDGYRPRAFDPRVGFFGVGFLDYATPLGSPLRQRWIVRHRLEKTDPAATRSPVKEPIVYYVDRGAPDPVRRALIEGASWWAAAFDRAGFVDAFRVELLPEDAHPLDVRYNVIQWVHRSTRGWSYGGGIQDPRTGEMIKGHVSLGSLRVRQDILLFEGLAGTDKTGTGAADDPIELALARIRQLAAHEVGHTLGLAHNFAASTADRASVMDYPAPWIQVREDSSLDFSKAYAVGVGTWDIHCIRYGYSEFSPGTDESVALDGIVRDGLSLGVPFLSDADARPASAAHPLAHLWDNGADAVVELMRSLAVRRIALSRFGPANVAKGRPLARLEEVLAPLYFHHRYQLDAAVKLVGGIEYTYAVRGDGQPGPRPVASATQRRALEAVLDILRPEVLDLPESVLRQLPPRVFGDEGSRELFGRRTAPGFDALGAAATAAEAVVQGLLQPERCARLVDQHRRDPQRPDVGEVLGALVDRVLETPPRDIPRRAEIRRTVRDVMVRGLVGLARDARAVPAVRAATEAVLSDVLRRVRNAPQAGPLEIARRDWIVASIRRHFERPVAPQADATGPPSAPPGSPIGQALRGCACGEP